MRKALIILAAAGVTASVWATDLNPQPGTGAGAITAYRPSSQEGGDKFKKLYDNLDVILNANQRNDMSSDNGIYYTYPNDPDRTWAYMFIKFLSDGGDHSYTCYWEAYTANNNNYGVTIWVWDDRPIEQGGQRWINKDAGPTGVWTTPRSFALESNYFRYDPETGEYRCWILLEGQTAPGARWMKCDVVDIHY